MAIRLWAKRGFDRRAIQRASGLPGKEVRRYLGVRSIYLETSAFNFFVDNLDLEEIELTRGFHRKKGNIFVTSPMLLWEIMLSSDRDRCDRMLLAAQALFDPILLATPSELVVRYLRSAYPKNIVNYSFFSTSRLGKLWRPMTADFSRTLSFEGHVEKAGPYRAVSKNFRSVIEGKAHHDEVVNLATEYVHGVYDALSDDLSSWGAEEITAKFVILYVFFLLMIGADVDREEVDAFWESLGFAGPITAGQPTKVFVDFPEIFVRGPLLEMANMASLQYRTGAANRGALYDGMHMAYAPYVDAILSNDDAFLRLGAEHEFYRRKVHHLSTVQITKVELPLARYPNDQKLRSLGLGEDEDLFSDPSEKENF